MQYYESLWDPHITFLMYLIIIIEVFCNVKLFPYHVVSLPPSARGTRAMLGCSVLMSKVAEMKALEDDSVEVVQLAKTAFNNLKVSTGIKHHRQCSLDQ